jgi:Glycosyl transferases group 1
LICAQTRAVQYTVRAVRASSSPCRLLIRSLLGSVVGSEVRISEPASFLATIPGVRTLEGCNVQFDDLGRAWPGKEKVFLQQRVVIPLADHVRRQRALLPPERLVEMRPSERTTVFFSALNGVADWAPLVSVLNGVLAEFGAQICVQVVYDRLFFDALLRVHKVFEPFSPYERYLSSLDMADIALLLLEPTRFNQHKSDLRFIECAAHGTIVLASSTVYGHSVVHGETRFVYHSPAEFESLLKRLVQDPDKASVAVTEERVHAARVEAPCGLPAGVVVDDAIRPAFVRQKIVVVQGVFHVHSLVWVYIMVSPLPVGEMSFLDWFHPASMMSRWLGRPRTCYRARMSRNS